jgi:hypothetical protein
VAADGAEPVAPNSAASAVLLLISRARKMPTKRAMSTGKQRSTSD